jgi:hypothetical protein
MPIRSLLSETGFNSDQTEMIAKAFDEAWAELQGGLSEPAMSSLIRTSLAKRIIEMAQRDGMTAKIGNSTYGCMMGFARLCACTRPRREEGPRSLSTLRISVARRSAGIRRTVANSARRPPAPPALSFFAEAR